MSEKIKSNVIKNSVEWEKYLHQLKTQNLSDEDILELAFKFPLEFENVGYIIPT